MWGHWELKKKTQQNPSTQKSGRFIETAASSLRHLTAALPALRTVYHHVVCFKPKSTSELQIQPLSLFLSCTTQHRRVNFVNSE